MPAVCLGRLPTAVASATHGAPRPSRWDPLNTSRKHWSELSRWQRVGIVIAAVVQIALQVAALVDLRRRPARRVRGDKRLWAAASFVNFAGPITYFLRARR